nr:MAG: capsid protein [Cressdnaviricota sp.]
MYTFVYTYFFHKKMTKAKMRGYRGRLKTAVRKRGRGVLRLSGGIKKRKASTATSGAKRMRSMTTTRRKKLDQNAHEHRGGSESRFTHGKRAKGLPARVASKLTALVFTQNIQNRQGMGGTPGRQLVADFMPLFPNTDLVTMMNQALLAQAQSSAAAGTSQTPTGFRTDRILLKKVNAELSLANSTNMTCRVELYDVIARRDIYPFTSLSSTQIVPTPTLAFAYGLQNELQTSSNTANQNVGTTPFDSQLFCKFWKIQKITHVILAPGQVHMHKVSYSPNYVLDNQLLSQTNMAAIGKLACYTMAVAVGQPILDATGLVTTGQVELLTIARQDYEFSYIPNNLKTMVNVNALATTNNSTTMGLNDIDGALEAAKVG